MNAVDAGAKSCRVSISKTRVLIVDDGKGFRSREEIESFFEVFGLPQDENENKVYGNFRMGRGQLFAFGRNSWKTGNFRMSVDIQNDGLDYSLTEKKERFKGCSVRVNLYNELYPSSLADTSRTLAKWVEWAPIDVYINDVLMSKDADLADWDHVTEDAYVKLKPTSSLEVYNLGIYVLTFPGWKFGMGGDVVSRKQLKVNFARNDIQSDCEVWKKIAALVSEKSTEKTIKNPSMTEDGRERVAHQLRYDVEYMEPESARHEFLKTAFLKTRLITAVTGRHYQAKGVGGYAGGNCSVAPLGDRLGDKLHRQKVAFVFAQETLERFDFQELKPFIAWLKAQGGQIPFNRGLFANLKVVDYDNMTLGMSREHVLLEDDELSSSEKVWLAVMRNTEEYVRRGVAYRNPRKIMIGSSESAQAWTDGSSYITVAREYLAKRHFTISAFFDVGSLLLHEYCHDEVDTAEHVHGQEFYEQFEDSVKCIGRFAVAAMYAVHGVMAKEKKNIPKRVLTQLDSLEGLKRAEKKWDVAIDDVSSQIPTEVAEGMCNSKSSM